MEHTPERTCFMCGEKAAKVTFTRIVAVPGGPVMIDGRGISPGRGVYFCRRRSECIGTLPSRGRVEFLLRRGLDESEWKSIKEAVLLAKDAS